MRQRGFCVGVPASLGEAGMVSTLSCSPVPAAATASGGKCRLLPVALCMSCSLLRCAQASSGYWEVFGIIESP